MFDLYVRLICNYFGVYFLIIHVQTKVIAIPRFLSVLIITSDVYRMHKLRNLKDFKIMKDIKSGVKMMSGSFSGAFTA